MRTKHITLVIVLLITGALKLLAQSPIAGFSGTPTSGCAPLTVSFTDQSYNNPVFWNWDLGNGQLSTVKNPSTTYNLPGVYTVRMVVRNSAGVDGVTMTNYITVYPSANVDFVTSAKIACSPTTINFFDKTTISSGSIMSWLWDFGDGTTSNLQNPTKTFTNLGYYNISLTVTTSNGCTVTRAKNRIIRIISGVKPNFDFDRMGNCSAPLSVNFLNQTSAPGVLNYRWDFGNGSTSTGKNPTTTYNSLGTYTVKVVTASNYGCVDSISKPIDLQSTNTQFTAPGNSCPGKPIPFINTSSPTPLSSTWDFGDGTGSNSISPTKIFNAPGTYTVKVINRYSFCTDSLTQTITISDPPPPDFSFVMAAGCQAPVKVNFTDLTPNSTTWFWEFGDGNTSTVKNPSHVYFTNGSYNVTLTVTTANGCPIRITKPSIVNIGQTGKVTISGFPQEGCIPLTVTPTVSISGPDPIASTEWDFGTGGKITGPNPSFTYTTKGTYSVTVKVTTVSGCIITKTVRDAVKVGTPPTVDFAVNKTSGCAGDPFQFTSNATPADKWQWNFGDGGSSSDQNPKYKFQDTGKMSVELIAYNNGCPNRLFKPDYVSTQAPVAKFDPQIVCNNRLNVSFQNQSITDPSHGVTTYSWNFGNGQTSTLKNPAPVSYAAFGIYNVTLTVSDNVCTYQSNHALNLFDLKNDFTVSKPDICRNEVFQLKFTALDPALIKEYTWQIGNGTPRIGGPTFNKSLSVTGKYDVTLTIKDIYGCINTLTKPGFVNIVGTDADFNVVNNGGCVNTQILLNDNSNPSGTIKSWDFGFGDGNFKLFTQAPMTYTYQRQGVYDIKLRTVDSYGCIDTVTKISAATISSPLTEFIADTISCPGAGVQFTDGSTGNSLTYSWDFGDGTKSTLKNPVHAYGKPDSTYTVKLTLIDRVGCVDSLVKPKYVRIVSPKAAFSLFDSSSICPPLETTFINESRNYDSLYWNFGDGNTTTLASPSNYYNDYGSYTAKLFVRGYGGCMDSASAQVNIYNPFTSTSFNYSPLAECNQLNVTFNITPPPGTKFRIRFGDGKSDDTTGAGIVTHLYDKPNFYFPSVFLTDSLDCQVLVSGANPILVKGVLPVFAMDKDRFCDTSSVQMVDYSIGNDSVATRKWDFGDGSTSTVQHPLHFYNTPGRYPVVQSVTTVTGCSASFADTVYVYRTPAPLIIGPTNMCVNQPVQFTASTVVPDTLIKYTWTLDNNQTSNSPVLFNRYSNAQILNYKLKATNELNCSLETNFQAEVHPLPIINLKPEENIVVGMGIDLPVSYSSGIISYTWTPDKNLTCTSCPVPYANPIFSTKYNVAVIDSNNCKANADIQLNVICGNLNYFIPNTFSPNNDGQNDMFYPRGSNLDRIQSMRIFNRWGELVFEKRNFQANTMSEGWNGLIKGKPAAIDAYVYIIEIICDNGQIVPVKGNVTLIR